MLSFFVVMKSHLYMHGIRANAIHSRAIGCTHYEFSLYNRTQNITLFGYVLNVHENRQEFSVISSVLQIVIVLSFLPLSFTLFTSEFGAQPLEYEKLVREMAKRFHSRKEIGKSKRITTGFIAIFTDKWNCRFVLLPGSCVCVTHFCFIFRYAL